MRILDNSKQFEVFNSLLIISLGMLDRLELNTSSDDKCAPGRLRNLQSFQIIILRHALLNFPTAKRIVYSTCSIYPEENEQVVDEVLSQVGDSYRLVPARTLMNDNWLNYSSTEFNCKDNCLYARPETDLSNGFFVAVFERNFDVPLPAIKKKKKKEMTENGDNVDEKYDKEEGRRKKNTVENKSSEANDGGKLNNLDELITEISNSDEVILTKKKKSKRKHDINDVENGDEEKSPDTSEILSKKKKKCKKSRSENEEVEHVEVPEDAGASPQKKKSKKSKKNHDSDEIVEKLDKKTFEHKEVRDEDIIRKKRKKNKAEID